MTELTGMTPQELSDWCKAQGMPAFRGKQIFRWIHQGADFDAMTNLPAAMRAQLKEIAVAQPVSIIDERKSQIDDTVKFLFGLKDGNCVEGVLMHYHHGYTLCISTQVGCAQGCRFCASGLAGWKRNLEAGEIVAQLMFVCRECADKGTRETGFTDFDNIVVMGMGEPLMNCEATMRALRIANAPWGLGVGARRITISTSGVVPKIRELADDPMQFRLAISLHGATDEVRSRIMPVNRKYPLAQLIPAAKEFSEKHGRMITLEFILIEDVNDSLEQARKLAEIARELHAHVNLIPYNAVEGLPWKRPSGNRQMQFLKVLQERRVPATLRREKGSGIDAACGQLRLRNLDKETA